MIPNSPGLTLRPNTTSFVHEDRAGDLAALEQLEGVVDLVEAEAARDELAQLDPAVHEEVDDHWQVDPLAGAAERGAGEDALLEQHARVDRDTGAVRRDADHVALAAAVDTV